MFIYTSKFESESFPDYSSMELLSHRDNNLQSVVIASTLWMEKNVLWRASNFEKFECDNSQPMQYRHSSVGSEGYCKDAAALA